jgi:acyl-CoA synthetase (AMP-forming)/AMP-acid ligase II
VDKSLPFGSSWWDLIARRADLTPDAVMLEDDRGRAITFDAYRAYAEEVAAGLIELGVKPGQVVSWQLPTTIEAAVLMAALSRLGVAQNPIIPVLRRAEVGQIVEQVGSDWLVVPGVWRNFDFEAMARDVLGPSGDVIVCDKFASSDPDGLLLPRGNRSDLPPAEMEATPPADGAIRWYYFTSGTTSAPKGAKHTDGSVMASAQYLDDYVGMVATDVLPVAFPLAHIGGAIMLVGQLRCGSRVLLTEVFDPVESPLVMADHGATLLGSAVPFFHAYLAAQRRHGPKALFPHLRLCMAGGAPTPPELHLELEQELGHGVINAWGLTEFPCATSLSVGDPPEKFLGSVGRPTPGVRVRVVGPDGTDRPVGEEGELQVRGPQCFKGYLDPALDADAFDEAGFFRTGDLGVVDADGFVWVTGRLKDVIIRNAENISALEVEEVLYEHPLIADVAVIGLPDKRTGERCCAVVVLAQPVNTESSATLTLEDLAAHCRERGLARHKIPEQLELVEVVPRNSMGKILKQELRARLNPT